jgi:hypothetical protein
MVEDRQEKLKQAAIQAIADTMAETVRFGSFDRKYIEACAERRLKESLAKLT